MTVVIPDKVLVTQGVLDKAHVICEIVKDRAAHPSEWYGLLISSKIDQDNGGFFARDIWIPEGVKASIGEVALSGEDVSKANVAIRKSNVDNGTDFYVIGWIHSHADGPTHHSTIDDSNFKTVLNSVSLNTERAERHPFPLVESETHVRITEGGVVEVFGDDDTDLLLQYVVPDEVVLAKLARKHGVRFGKKVNGKALVHDLLQLMPAAAFESKFVGFGYSIVVNDAQETPFAAVGRVVQGSIDRKIKFKSSETEVGLVVVDNNIVVDRSALEELIDKNVRFDVPKVKRVSVLDLFFNCRLDGEHVPGVPVIEGEPGLSCREVPISGDSTPISPVLKPGAYRREDLVYKKDSGEVSVSQLVQLFIFKGASYITMWDHRDVKYSLYVHGLLDRIRFDGLCAIIGILGPLKEDPDPLSEPKLYSFSPVAAKYTIEKFFVNRDGTVDNLQIDFMRAFVEGDVNKALEEWVPKIYERWFSEQEARSTLSNWWSALQEGDSFD